MTLLLSRFTSRQSAHDAMPHDLAARGILLPDDRHVIPLNAAPTCGGMSIRFGRLVCAGASTDAPSTANDFPIIHRPSFQNSLRTLFAHTPTADQCVNNRLVLAHSAQHIAEICTPPGILAHSKDIPEPIVQIDACDHENASPKIASATMVATNPAASMTAVRIDFMMFI